MSPRRCGVRLNEEGINVLVVAKKDRKGHETESVQTLLEVQTGVVCVDMRVSEALKMPV